MKLWMMGVVTAIGILLSKQEQIDSFYHFGPSPTLIVLGIRIDTPILYVGVIVYCFLNTCVRTINNQIVSPWVTNVVHDTSVSKEGIPKDLIYDIVMVNVIYTWVDWFIYFNLLCAQIDMVIVEICTDIIISFVVTQRYLIPTDGYTSLNDK